MEKEKLIDKVAGILYETYCNEVGGVAWNGDPLPNWEEFSTDTSKQKQCNGWKKVAEWCIESGKKLID